MIYKSSRTNADLISQRKFNIRVWFPLWGIYIPIWGRILIVIAFLCYEIVTFRLGRRAFERKPVIWAEAIVGRCGKATTPLTPKGYVQVNGELWRALSSDMNIDEGDDIVVLELNRLTLRVAPLSGIRTRASVKLETESE